MKKVKLTTMTLALLAGTVVAPIVSTAAELEKQATVESSEVVVKEEPKAEAEGEVTPVEPTEETPVTPAPEQKEDNKGEVAQPTTPEVAKPEAAKPAPKAEEVDPAKELRQAQDNAHATAQALLAAGDITHDEYVALYGEIYAAKSVQEVKEIEIKMSTMNKALNDAKAAASKELFELKAAYKISESNFYAYEERVRLAQSQAEIDVVLGEARTEAALFDAKLAGKTEVQGLVDGYGFTDAEALEFQKRIQLATTPAEIDGIVAEAHAAAELGAMRFEAKTQLWALVDDTITQEEYFVYANQIDAATTQAEIDSILANAAEFVDLKEYKNEAYYTLSDMHYANEDTFTLIDYSEFAGQVDAATNKAEVDQALAGAEARLELNEAKKAALQEISDLISEGVLEDTDWAVYAPQVDAATSIAEVNAVLDQIEAKLALAEAKELAKDVILELAHAELIDSGEYWDFVDAIDAATSIEEVNSIVDEAQTLATLRQAQKDANDELFSLLVTSDITMLDYYHYTELVDNAKSAEEVNEIMATVNALVSAREAAVKELDGFYKEELLTLVETNGFKYQIEDVRTAEEVEAIMVEARALADSRRIEEITESTITVNYVDENGKSIKDSESVTKEVGETHVFEAATIEGYELQGPSSLELTFSDAPQTVTFSYKKLEEAKQEGTITVQYLDKDGKEVKASDKLTKEVGTKEIIEAPAIKGYKVVGPKALSVEYVETAQTVAFTYEKVKDNGGKEEGNGGKGEGNNNNGNKGKENNKGNKGESKKDGNKKSELPQTGEAAANAGLVAGGILSMLSAAFVFFRKGK